MLSTEGLASLARKELRAIQAGLRNHDANPERWPFQDAAAVLISFNPDTICPVGLRKVKWSDFSRDCEPVRASGSGAHWTLKNEVRRAALRRLRDLRHMQRARQANVGRGSNPAQPIFDAVISKSLPDPDSLSRQELGWLITIMEWLEGIVSVGFTLDDVRRRLPVADLLAPMRKLAGQSFVGRESELEILREYVGILPPRSRGQAGWRFLAKPVSSFAKQPPLMIAGTGGVGKSTLLARFILQHVEQAKDNKLPFVYLDIDRPFLQPAQPSTLIGEAARQLAIQWPALKRALERVAAEADDMIASYDFAESTKTSADVHDLVLSLRKALLPLNDRPTLMVIDTFEEAQYLGPDVVRNLWSVLADLQEQLPMLRSVICGRASLRGEVEPLEEIVLGDLPRKDGLALLRLGLGATTPKLSMAVLDEILSLVGTNPMSLKLAAAIVKDQGPKALVKPDSRSQLILRVKSQTVQARLYGRMLTHLHGKNLQALVYPGLVVRRITADVIRKVLAEPCDINLTDTSAKDLVAALSRERAFIDVDPEDGALLYRTDVRRAMLRDLAGYVTPTTVAAIHDNAVAHYTRASDIRARAEELYHRLMRGDAAKTLDIRWTQGVEQYLRTAMEELPSKAQIWLAQRLGVTPRAGLRQQATLEEWEGITSTAIQRFLDTGDTRSALAVLAERRDRSPSSALWRLGSEAYRLSGNTKKATAIASQGIAAASDVGDTVTVRALLRQRALVHEGARQTQAALTDINEALQLEGGGDWQLDQLRLLTGRIRLLRKLGSKQDGSRREAIDRLKSALTPDVLASLDQSPVLLTELVAEIGTIDDRVLTKVLDTIGLSVKSDAQARKFAEALNQWDHATGGGLSRRVGLKISDVPGWNRFVKETSSRRLASTILNSRDSVTPKSRKSALPKSAYSALPKSRKSAPPKSAYSAPLNSFIDEAIVQTYRSSVEATLTRPKRIKRVRRPIVSKRARLK